MAGARRMATLSRFSSAMVSFGVAAGAASPYHDTDSYPGRPDSAIVGMSGKPGTRFAVDTPIARSRPALTCVIDETVLDAISAMRPATRSITPGPGPL